MSCPLETWKSRDPTSRAQPTLIASGHVQGTHEKDHAAQQQPYLKDMDGCMAQGHQTSHPGHAQSTYRHEGPQADIDVSGLEAEERCRRQKAGHPPATWPGWGAGPAFQQGQQATEGRCDTQGLTQRQAQQAGDQQSIEQQEWIELEVPSSQGRHRFHHQGHTEYGACPEGQAANPCWHAKHTLHHHPEHHWR